MVRASFFVANACTSVSEVRTQKASAGINWLLLYNHGLINFESKNAFKIICDRHLIDAMILILVGSKLHPLGQPSSRREPTIHTLASHCRLPPPGHRPRQRRRRQQEMSAAVQHLPRKESRELSGHEGAVLAVRFNRDGNYCLSCGKDRTLRLWNPHTGALVKTYKSHAREVRDVHSSSDNAKLVSCGADRQIFYWDVSTGRVIRKFRGHNSEVNSVKFNEYNAVVVSAGYDRTVRAFDCRSQSSDPIQTIDTFQDSVMSVILTKTEIIAGSVDGTVRTFDIRMGRETVDNLGHPVNCISLSNDSNCLLANCLDSTVRLLDKTTGELLQEYKGHACKSFKMDCCLTNDDAYVVGGSEDGYIFFWELVDAPVVASFRAHSSVVTSISYHPTKACMLTSSVDGSVRVWN